MIRARHRPGVFEAIAASSIALTGLCGCADLKELATNQCGNRVVESEAGEDCDGEAGCAEAGAAHECRYTCAADGSATCPSGYGCGVDGVCRRPSGAFDVLRAGTTVTTRDVLVGDINADGCAEAILSASRSTVIEAYSSPLTDACVAGEQTLSTNRPSADDAPLPQPSLVDLSEGGSRLSLMAGSRGLYGDGLSVYFTNGSPTLTPVLYPVFQRPGALLRTLKLRLRGKDVVLALELPSGATKTDASLIFDPQKKPETYAGALPFALSSIGAIAAADVEGDAAPADQRCDEVVIAPRGSKQIVLYHACGAGDTYTFVPVMGPPVTLDSGAAVRDENQVIVARDINNDGHVDLVLNADDASLHVAYGLGDGRFDSKDPPSAAPDSKTSALSVNNAADLTRADGIFVAGDFDAKNPGLEYVGLPCPPASLFESPTCAKREGSCEAVVADIDGDGDEDIISTEGQELDIAVRRRVADGVFHVTFVKTSCPPHELGVGDLDGDGVSDIAFFDQASKGPGEASTSLSVAYGNSLGDPSAPAASGRFDEAVGLSVVGIGQPGSGAQVAVARSLDGGKKGSALGVVEIGNERAPVAPFYFSSEAEGQPKKPVELLAQAAGSFVTNDGRPAGNSLAVITKSESDGIELWLLTSDADSGSLSAKRSDPSVTMNCLNGCMLAALPTGAGLPDKLVVLGDDPAVIYEASSGAFAESSQVTTSRTFRSVIEGSNPKKYAPRPLVGLLDGDALPDILASDASGALVGLFGTDSGGLAAQELIAAPGCAAEGSCTGYAAAQIDADGDGGLDLAVVGPSLFEVDSVTQIGGQRSLEKKAVTLGVPTPPESADFTALSAADADGDGVKDLFVMTNSNFFTVLRGRPVRQ